MQSRTAAAVTGGGSWVEAGSIMLLKVGCSEPRVGGSAHGSQQMAGTLKRPDPQQQKQPTQARLSAVVCVQAWRPQAEWKAHGFRSLTAPRCLQVLLHLRQGTLWWVLVVFKRARWISRQQIKAVNAQCSGRQGVKQTSTNRRAPSISLAPLQAQPAPSASRLAAAAWQSRTC